MNAPRWILALLPSLVLSAEEPFRTLSFTDALAAAKKEQKVVLVDFFTTWCPPCKMLDRVTWKDEAVRAWLSANTVALKIDAEAEREIAAKYKVVGYPSLVFIRPDGSEMDRIVGYREPKAFLSEAGNVLAGRTQVDVLRERYEATKGEDVDVRLELARELAQRGQQAEALEHLMWCWDHGLEAAFVGVRSSFLLRDIAALGAQYPAALEALRSRSDACEKTLLEGRGTPGVARDFAALNRVLGDDEETLRVYDALAGSTAAPGSDATALRKSMFGEVLDPLLEAKRYGDILEGAGDCGQVIEQRIGVYRHTLERFKDEEQSPAGYMKGQVVVEGGKYFEAALGAGRTSEAAALADQLIAFEASRATFETLVKHAIRAGSQAGADELLGRAREVLPEKDCEKIERKARRERAR